MHKNITAFLAVANHNSLTEAAEHLHVTQPTLTKRIANLETTVGATLFLRERRGMSLTPSGNVFLRRAKRIDAEYRQCLEEIATINSAGLSIMRVGAGPLFQLTWIAGLFSALKKEFPELELELRTDKSVGITEMLADGEIDVYLGVTPKGPLDDSIFVKYLTHVEHGIIVRKDNPQSAQSTINASLLSDYSWVSFLHDQETENRILKYSVPKGAKVSLVEIRTTSFATGLQLVREGGFIMSAPLQLARLVENEGLVMRPATGGMPRRRAGVHFRKSAMGYRSIQVVLNYFIAINFNS